MFPARAGVIPTPTDKVSEIIDVPRASGGDPSTRSELEQVRECSPRERG
ncbi:Uncharacterised protein [Fusobacterium naviforme]|nr:Uncharacterised protein [Fusobacterium naviforme]